MTDIIPLAAFRSIGVGVDRRMLVAVRTTEAALRYKPPSRKGAPSKASWTTSIGFRSSNRLLLLGLLLVQAAVGACGEFLLELIDSASRINKFQLAGIERMALVTDIDL